MTEQEKKKEKKKPAYVRRCKKDEDKQKMGRPKKDIDLKIFEGLCEIQCTTSEIASVFRVTVETVQNRVEEHYKQDYLEIYKSFTEKGKTSLRRTQFKLAKTNASMAIWLGKQYLGQRDQEKEALESQQRQHFYMLARQLNMITPTFDNKNLPSETPPRSTSSEDLSSKKCIEISDSDKD